MDLRLYQNERVRVSSDGNVFADIDHKGYKCLGVEVFAYNKYLEVREKQNHVKLFTFEKKSHKKEYDFGFWDDAAVVWAFNPNGKDS